LEEELKKSVLVLSSLPPSLGVEEEGNNSNDPCTPSFLGPTLLGLVIVEALASGENF
jgi:hypothetical protein